MARVSADRASFAAIYMRCRYKTHSTHNLRSSHNTWNKRASTPFPSHPPRKKKNPSGCIIIINFAIDYARQCCMCCLISHQSMIPFVTHDQQDPVRISGGNLLKIHIVIQALNPLIGYCILNILFVVAIANTVRSPLHMAYIIRSMSCSFATHIKCMQNKTGQS